MKSQAKGDGPKPPTGDEKPGDSAKSEGTKTDGQNVAQRKSDGGGEGEPKPEEMKPQDVADLAKDLKSDDPKSARRRRRSCRRPPQMHATARPAKRPRRTSKAPASSLRRT